MIAFRTGADATAIDAVFRQSALYRDKWERDDYRESTIDLGIKACNGTFHCSQMQHPEFVKFNEQTGEAYVSVPLLAAHVRENLDYILVRDNGKQGVVKYVYENGHYVLYADNMLMGIIKKYIADYDEELVKMHQVTSVLQHLLTDLNYIRQDELNANENIINFKNGLLNLTTNELLPHSPDVYSTIQIPCNWTSHPSETPVFDKYMKTLTGGNKETEQLLLEFIGVTLSNVKGWRMKKALFLVGDGNTGKSQLKSLTEKLLGSDNYIGIDLKEIEARFGTGAVYSTRLAGSSDMSFLTVDELKTFKKMTGGDALYAEFKGQQEFTYVFNGLLWFCMNRLPKFGGDDGKWVYDRIMIVNCPNVIPQHKQDKRLLDKMYAEREGIVYKAIMALKKIIANGYRFTEPENVIGARVQYMTENNTVISFFEECMCARPDGKIADAATTGRIYDVYKAWCKDNNNGFHKTAKEFREILSAHLGSTFKELTVHTNKGSFYKAYTIWHDSTIVRMFSMQEYLGDTVNFKTYRKSYKQRKQIHHDPSEWQIFENTHEAIIDKEIFDIVQRIRDGQRRLTPMGEMPILSGMIFCADCGKKLYQVRGRSLPQKEYMVCSTYRKIKGGCSSHQIRNEVIEALLLDGIRNITAFAKEHEGKFVEMLVKKSKAETDRSLRESKHELEQSQARITKLDGII